MKFLNENKEWCYINKQGVARKLLINPSTSMPYRPNEVILEGKYKNKVFAQYRYDRPLTMWDKDYWGIKTRVVAETLSRDIPKSYKIPTPAAISFSGGRTSAYLLKQILLANDNKLPNDILVCFANTGKEMPETLDFVHEVEKQWDVDIHWLELEISETSGTRRTKKVTYETASRNGEPFAALLTKTQMLPSIRRRLCTVELKINVINRYVQSLGYNEWYSALGLRYDEPKRVHDSRSQMYRHINICPLYDAKVTNEDVLDFWRQSNFDLTLPVVAGRTAAGNCDLCFLKGTKTTLNLLHERPELADWWIEKEFILETTFRTDRPNYIELGNLAKEPPKDYIDDQHFTCFCHD